MWLFTHFKFKLLSLKFRHLLFLLQVLLEGWHTAAATSLLRSRSSLGLRWLLENILLLFLAQQLWTLYHFKLPCVIRSLRDRVGIWLSIDHWISIHLFGLLDQLTFNLELSWVYLLLSIVGNRRWRECKFLSSRLWQRNVSTWFDLLAKGLHLDF